METNERIYISFYKGDIGVTFKNKDDVEMSVINFPKTSQYNGYHWFYRTAWINEYKKDDSTKYNADKRYVSLPQDYDINIVKTERNEAGEWVQVDKKVISANDLKEAMKRAVNNDTKS